MEKLSVDGQYNVKIKHYLTFTEYSFYSYKRYLTNPEQKHNNSFYIDVNKNRADSYRRAYSNLFDIIHSNNWDYFATFTFKNPIYRYDYDYIVKSMNRFFMNVKANYDSGIKYLYVIEQHKKGGYHIHALLNGISPANLEPALFNGHKIIKNGKQVFHYKPYKKGFQNITEIGDLTKTGNYILKYISKELCMEGKRSYYCSQKLFRPTVNYRYDENFDIKGVLPTFPEDTITKAFKCSELGYNVFVFRESL